MLTKHFKVAKRYARALYSLAKENGLEERTYEDMKVADKVFSSSNELRAIIASPVIREGKKQRILRALFEKRFHELNIGYFMIVVRKQRAILLPSIARAFLGVYKEAMGIEPVKVITASGLNEILRKKALQVASHLTDKKIEFSEDIQPRIIGGFILHLGDRQYDASIHTRLVNLRKQLHV